MHAFLDLYSSKTLIHEQVYFTIQTHIINKWLMHIFQHWPILLINTLHLLYNIIFEVNFFTKVHNLVCWMEYVHPSATDLIFLQQSLHIFFHHLILNKKPFDNWLGNACIKSYATCINDAKSNLANIHDVDFDQHHLSLDQHIDLFDILSKHRK